MGAWHIAIDGHGVHDNGLPHDAEQRVREFVEQLQTDGHAVHNVSVTIGSAREYVPSSTHAPGFYRELPAYVPEPPRTSPLPVDDEATA